MTDQTPLKACPFCGGKNVELGEHYGMYNEDVQCQDCYAIGPIFKEFDGGKKAIEAWNTRTGDKMTDKDMPDEIWVEMKDNHKIYGSLFAHGYATKYTRADIAQAYRDEMNRGFQIISDQQGEIEKFKAGLTPPVDEKVAEAISHVTFCKNMPTHNIKGHIVLANWAVETLISRARPQKQQTEIEDEELQKALEKINKDGFRCIEPELYGAVKVVISRVRPKKVWKREELDSIVLNDIHAKYNQPIVQTNQYSASDAVTALIEAGVVEVKS